MRRTVITLCGEAFLQRNAENLKNVKTEKRNTGMSACLHANMPARQQRIDAAPTKPLNCETVKLRRALSVKPQAAVISAAAVSRQPPAGTIDLPTQHVLPTASAGSPRAWDSMKKSLLRLSLICRLHAHLYTLIRLHICMPAHRYAGMQACRYTGMPIRTHDPRPANTIANTI